MITVLMIRSGNEIHLRRGSGYGIFVIFYMLNNFQKIFYQFFSYRICSTYPLLYPARDYNKKSRKNFVGRYLER